MAAISKSAIDSLVTKIEGLDLTSDEIAVLDAVLSAAESASGVEGFGLERGEPMRFGLPDLRLRMKSVVINHEEQ